MLLVCHSSVCRSQMDGYDTSESPVDPSLEFEEMHPELPARKTNPDNKRAMRDVSTSPE